MAQHTGTVVWFNNAKGFGFLKAEDGTETFVHYTAVQAAGYKSLKEGEAVEYDVEVGSSGKPQAGNVKRMG